MTDEGLPEYEVATYWHDDVIGKVTAYIRYRSWSKEGEKIYRIRAASGYLAKREALRLRKREGP